MLPQMARKVFKSLVPSKIILPFEDRYLVLFEVVNQWSRRSVVRRNFSGAF